MTITPPSLATRASGPGAFAALPLIAFGVVLRLGFLGTDSFWLDEAYSVAVVLQHSAREVWQTSVDPNHPPLFFAILRATLRVAGTSETTARLPSALASVCSLGLLFVLARRLGASHGAALTAVVLLALSPVDIWYAQEARMYAMVATAALAFAIGLTLDSWTGALLASLTLTTGLYVDFTMVPLSAALISLWVVRWWHIDRRPGRLALVATASAVGWLAFKPRWAQLELVLGRIDTVPLFVRLRESIGLHLSPGPSALGVAILLALAIGIAAALVWRAIGRSGRYRTWWGWIVWAGFVAGTAALALPRGYSAKQFLATGWPFVVLVVAWTLTDGERAETGRGVETALRRLRLPLAIGVSLVAGVVTVATPRADWRGVVSYLNGREARTAAVWLDPAWNAYPYNYYRPATAAISSPVVVAGVPVLDAAGADVCVVAERFGRTPPTSPTEAWLDRHFRLVDATAFARLQVRCYTRVSR